jgi:hypothetical protein
MKSFRFEPVRWATTALAILGALIGANDQFDILPVGVTPYLNYAAAVLAILLGVAVRNRVTPLAAPRDSAGVGLVPAPMVTGKRPGSGPADRPSGLGMAGW